MKQLYEEYEQDYKHWVDLILPELRQQKHERILL